MLKQPTLPVKAALITSHDRPYELRQRLGKSMATQTVSTHVGINDNRLSGACRYSSGQSVHASPTCSRFLRLVDKCVPEKIWGM
ncbi:hypothetical protein E2C01_001927 [Portunus trituberculatus]|uniref:Uncharacterized protein n=1 Tax=Portunus trituberculatus TaxID=210409 RepID=A0A5B7CII4_PORTR|nr:hypothetical protein [Portunus trituberculatus]